jgi:hypothetical protein
MGFSWKKALAFAAPIAAIVVPGIGTAVGTAILGGSAAATAAAVGLTVAEVTAAVGAATIAAGSTALQGGTVEDVFISAASAGVASGVNFAAGGGVTGAAAGSVAGTAIRGGDASQVLTNAFAAGVGAGVQDAMPNNPDAGKIIGSAAKTYITTGGNIDQTLLNTTVTAIGTLDKQQPAPIESRTTGGQQVDANTVLATNFSGTGDEMASALAGMMSTQKPGISNIDDFKSFVNDELLKSQFDPTAQAQPLINQAGRMIGPAVGAAGRVIIPVAEEVVMPAAMRFAANNPQYAAETAQYLSKMGMAGAAAAVVTSFGLSSDTVNLPSAQLQGLIDQIPKSNLPVAKPETFDPGTGTGWDAAKTTTTPAKVATTPAKVTDTGDESARLLARFPPPGTARTSDLSVMGGAEGDPIYTQLTAAINSGVDPYVAIENMVGAAKEYGVDPTSYLNDLIDAAAITGLDPEKTVGVAVDSMYKSPAIEAEPNIDPNVNPNVNPNVDPSLNPNANPNINPNLDPAINPNLDPAINPNLNLASRPNLGQMTNPNLNPNLNLNRGPATPSPPTTGVTRVPGFTEFGPFLTQMLGEPSVPGGPSEISPNQPGTELGPPDIVEEDLTTVEETPTVPDTPDVPTGLPPDTSPELAPDASPEVQPDSITPPGTEPEPERVTRPRKIYATVTQTPRPRRPAPTTITGPSPARLLADALAAYRPAGAIEGAESGKERQKVWNEKSLRLKDALGL